MIELFLSKERKVRVWFDGLPSVVNAPKPIQYRREVHGTPVSVAHRVCALELLIPLGGRFNYGLLGCSVNDLPANQGIITVDAGVRHEELFGESLAKNLEPVHWGLDGEFAESVLDGAVRGIAQFGLPGKEIHFYVAAHGDVGATPRTFDRLGRLLIALVTLESTSQEDVLNLLESALSE